METREKAVVVFSGGQDSTTCLFWALKHFKEVIALCFRYGQKHIHEVDMARAIARRHGVLWKEPYQPRGYAFVRNGYRGPSTH